MGEERAGQTLITASGAPARLPPLQRPTGHHDMRLNGIKVWWDWDAPVFLLGRGVAVHEIAARR